MNENDIIHLHEIVWILECCDFSILFFTPVLIEMSSPCPAPPWRWARPARWLGVRPSLALLSTLLFLYQSSPSSRQVFVSKCPQTERFLTPGLPPAPQCSGGQTEHLPHHVQSSLSAARYSHSQVGHSRVKIDEKSLYFRQVQFLWAGWPGVHLLVPPAEVPGQPVVQPGGGERGGALWLRPLQGCREGGPSFALPPR